MKRFTLPTITADRMIQAQRDFNEKPTPWQAFWEAETQSLCRIQRNRAGEIVYLVVEGPLDREQAAYRLQQIIDAAQSESMEIPREQIN